MRRIESTGRFTINMQNIRGPDGTKIVYRKFRRKRALNVHTHGI